MFRKSVAEERQNEQTKMSFWWSKGEAEQQEREDEWGPSYTVRGMTLAAGMFEYSTTLNKLTIQWTQKSSTAEDSSISLIL